ncbi:hypothetical protein PLICRDRAFT_177156 [Plicaturopsis crispa FD-325 SS-3]|nr:hypothetical protein PLICRDRAFT_177156 [Plicaturopsis crispa FD-325 SS-3]
MTKAQIAVAESMNTSNPDSGLIALGEVSAHSRGDMLDAARQHVDSEIVRIEQSIRDFKTRRNSFALTSRLPPEVLSEIFMFCRGDDFSIYALRWIAVTHVCRGWRDVALNFPRLWSSIVLKSPAWTKEMLKRSENMPLTIMGQSQYRDKKNALSLKPALKHLARISTLHLTSTSECMDELFGSVDSSAPVLESLELVVPTQSDSKGYNLPETFCAGLNPTLRNLFLSSCSIPWDFPFVNNLKVLKLELIPVASRPSVSDILGLLGRTSFLTILSLGKDSIAHSREESVAATEMVNLPCLISVHVSSSVDVCSMLLKKLTLPLAAVFTFVCGLDYSYTMHLRNPLPALNSWSVGLQMLDIRLDSRARSIQIRAWNTTAEESSTTRIAPRLTITFDVPTYGDSERGDQYAVALCRSLSLDQLQSLVVVDLHRMTCDAWEAIFRQCTLVRKIEVSEDAVSGLITALDPRKAGFTRDIPTEHDGLFFPALRDLTLSGVDFNPLDDYRLQLDTLCSCFKDRARCSATLEKLSLRNCAWVESDCLFDLEDVIDEVDWDGVVSRGSPDRYSGDPWSFDF